MPSGKLLDPTRGAPIFELKFDTPSRTVRTFNRQEGGFLSNSSAI
jgi:hypothetical protein